MEIQKVMDIALTAGEILFAYGAESYRIEETVDKICSSFQYSSECITVSNGIWITINHKDNPSKKITNVKKVSKNSVDLYRIELINDLSRKLQSSTIEYDEIIRQLKYIKNSPTFSFKVRLFAAIMTGFIYTLFFNGNIIDGLISIITCTATYIMLEMINKIGFFEFLEYYLSGLLIGILSILAGNYIPHANSNNIITGSIMILLPGVILTNGIKDILYGDFSSGISRFFEALLVIAAVSAGIATSMLVLKGI